MNFGTIAQAIDVIVRHRPGITKAELAEVIGCDPRSITLDCDWLADNGHIRIERATPPQNQDRCYPAR